jgi:molecular chaperone HtpG
MERYFKSLQGRQDGGMFGEMRAERVLELNAEHPSFLALKEAFDSDKEKAAQYSRLLYGQALLTAGVPLEDPAEFSELVSALLFG